jgi:PKD repeat protein
MHPFKQPLIFVFFLFGTCAAYAQPKLEWAMNKIAGQPLRFMENKGQVVDQSGKLRNDVKYIYNDGKGFKLILRETGFSYEMYGIEKPEKEAEMHAETPGQNLPATLRESAGDRMKTRRVDMNLIGANPHAQIVAEEKSEDYVNYYKEYTPEEGVRRIYFYSKITYKNIYPHIDFVFIARPDGALKYDIIVHPGGKLSDIKMRYDGMDSLRLQEGKLAITTSLGKIMEEIPASYIWETGQKQDVSYTMYGDMVSFTGAYNKKETLIIDPVIRQWATYYGGSDSDYGYSVAVDGSGNVYMAGTTYSTSGIASSGAYQTSKGGSDDAFLVKFNASGSRQWTTYYGGSSTEDGSSVAVDGSGNVYMAGYTYSTSGIASSGAYQTSNGGGSNYDAYLVKFNSSGSRQWATYYGGSGNDFGYSVAVDGSGNVYMSGYTTSTSGIASSGAYQTSNGGGYSDAYLVKFNSSGSRQWATYYGGSGNDYGWSVTVDGSGNVYLAGHTYKGTSGIASSGAYQTSYGGGEDDAYLVKFNSGGSRQWATYYGGSSFDWGYSVAVDGSGNVYMAGRTSSTSGIASSGAYQTSNGGGGNFDAFLVKFNSSGSRQWATYYGGSDLDDGFSVAVDDSGNVYIIGQTSSTSGIASSGAYQTSHGGGGDAFLVKFNKSGSRQWATYYGGSGDDYGWSVAVDGSGNVYMAGYTYSTSGIASSGAYQTSHGGGTLDAFLAKFSEMDAGVLFIDSLSDYCGSVTRNIDVRIKNFSPSEILDSVYIGWSVNGTLQSTAKYTLSLKPGDTSAVINLGKYLFGNGTHNLKVWIYKPNGGTDADPSNDTLTKSVTIYPRASVSFSASDACMNNGISFTSGSSVSSGSINGYLWKFGDGTTSSSTSPSKSYSMAGSYTVWLIAATDNGCKDSTSRTVTVFPRPEVAFSAATRCQDSAVIFTNASTIDSGYTIGSYEWHFGDGTVSTDISPAHKYPSTGTYTVSLIATSDKGCIDSASFTLVLDGYPIPVANFSATGLCGEKTTAFINNTSISSPYSIASYKWYFGDGDSSSQENPKHTYSLPGTYAVMLIATSNTGCRDSVSKTVTVFPRPEVAFSAATRCKDSSVIFSNSTTIGSGYTIASYEWHFGDGTVSSEINPVYKYASPGTYTIWLTATSDKGCKDSAGFTLVLDGYPRPVAGFSVTELCSEKPAIFTNSSIISPTYSIASYQWYFGDGDSSTDANPQHIYSLPGTYTITLVATGNTGCKDTATQTLTVEPTPLPSFSYESHCADTAIDFINKSTISFGAISFYSWNFGDGTFSTEINPSHAYKNPGTYLVSLIAGNGDCWRSVSSQVIVYPSPGVSFSTPGNCIGETTVFSNSSSIDPPYSIASYYWRLGDGSVSTDYQPTHTYAKTGTYEVTLIATSNTGCVDSMTHSISVNPPPVAQFTYTVRGRTVILRPLRQDGAEYHWDMGDGNTISLPYRNSLEYTYKVDGSYRIKLEIVTEQGCRDTTEGLIALNNTFSFALYPNPFISTFEFHYTLPSEEEVTLSLFDISGKNLGVFYHANDVVGTHTRLIRTAAPGIAPGMYIVRASFGQEVYYVKMVKLK